MHSTWSTVCGHLVPVAKSRTEPTMILAMHGADCEIIFSEVTSSRLALIRGAWVCLRAKAFEVLL